MGIFKANDIRGVYGIELHDEDAYKIGIAFAQFVKGNTIVVGKDNRVSSPSLMHSAMKGVLNSGKNVIDIGTIDSPGLYFASHKFKVPGIMVTASHNPPRYNGFYLVDKDAVPIYQDNKISEVEKLYRKAKTKNKIAQIKVEDIRNEYEKHIVSFVDKKKIKPMKIVVDAGNGVGSIIMRRLMLQFRQINFVPLYFESDGNFPNRGPDTTIDENLASLQNAVRKERADFGIAFDGDADRAAFVDEKGEIISGSIIGALLADNILKSKDKVVYTIGCSKIVSDVLDSHKAKAFREKVGHSFVSARMRKEKATLGVEHTGHFFYKDNFYTESPFITMLKISEIYSKNKKPMSRIIEPYRKYYSIGEISYPVKDQNAAIDKIKKIVESEYRVKADTFDGLFVDCKDFWFRIRASQTEPLIRLTIEGKSKSFLDNEKNKLERIIQKVVK